MKLINAELKKKGLKLNQLPAELKDRIDALQQMIFTFNEAYDNWEEGGEDKEEKAELDEKEHEIAEEESSLAREIREIGKEPAPAPTPEPAPAPTPEPEKKEETGIGWLVFGAVVLVGTLGLVNVLKKK